MINHKQLCSDGREGQISQCWDGKCCLLEYNSILQLRSSGCLVHILEGAMRQSLVSVRKRGMVDQCCLPWAQEGKVDAPRSMHQLTLFQGKGFCREINAILTGARSAGATLHFIIGTAMASKGEVTSLKFFNFTSGLAISSQGPGPLKEQKKRKYKEKERMARAHCLYFPILLQVISLYKKAKIRRGKATNKHEGGSFLMGQTDISKFKSHGQQPIVP